VRKVALTVGAMINRIKVNVRSFACQFISSVFISTTLENLTLMTLDLVEIETHLSLHEDLQQAATCDQN